MEKSSLLKELQDTMKETLAIRREEIRKIQEMYRAKAGPTRSLLEKVAAEFADNVAEVAREAARRGRGEITLTRTGNLKLFLALQEFREKTAGTGWTADEILGKTWGLPVRCTNDGVTVVWWLHPPGDNDLARRLDELKAEGLVHM